MAFREPLRSFQLSCLRCSQVKITGMRHLCSLVSKLTSRIAFQAAFPSHSQLSWTSRLNRHRPQPLNPTWAGSEGTIFCIIILDYLAQIMQNLAGGIRQQKHCQYHTSWKCCSGQNDVHTHPVPRFILVWKELVTLCTGIMFHRLPQVSFRTFESMLCG